MTTGAQLNALFIAIILLFLCRHNPWPMATTTARVALESGEILPLQTIIAQLEQVYPGQILEVELERDDGLWIYEIKLVRANGVLIKIELDASDGRLLSVKGAISLRLQGPKDSADAGLGGGRRPCPGQTAGR